MTIHICLGDHKYIEPLEYAVGQNLEISLQWKPYYDVFNLLDNLHRSNMLDLDT